MKMKLVTIALTVTLSLVSQSAIAQTAPKPSKIMTHVHSAPQAMTPKAVKASPVKIQAAETRKTSRIVRVVHEPLPGQSKAIRSVSKGRVIHTAEASHYDMTVYRPSTTRRTTPNLYRD